MAKKLPEAPPAGEGRRAEWPRGLRAAARAFSAQPFTEAAQLGTGHCNCHWQATIPAEAGSPRIWPSSKPAQWSPRRSLIRSLTIILGNSRMIGGRWSGRHWEDPEEASGERACGSRGACKSTCLTRGANYRGLHPGLRTVRHAIFCVASHCGTAPRKVLRTFSR